jgi:hypothetical protein
VAYHIQVVSQRDDLDFDDLPFVARIAGAEISGAHAMSELLCRACIVTLSLCPIAIAVIVLFM